MCQGKARGADKFYGTSSHNKFQQCVAELTDLVRVTVQRML